MCLKLSSTNIAQDVFPVPSPIPADPTLTIEELFAGNCPPNHDPQTVLVLHVSDLRRELECAIRARGYIPA